MTRADLPPTTCPHIDLLIALLGGFPSGDGRRATENMVERLDLLEHAAREKGVREETLVAVKGARILLGLSHLPPLGMPFEHNQSRSKSLRSG